MPVDLTYKVRNPVMRLLAQHDGEYWSGEQDPLFRYYAAEISELARTGLVWHRTDSGLGALEGLELTRAGRRAANLPERETVWTWIARDARVRQLYARLRLFARRLPPWARKLSEKAGRG
ncbi:hypothetical protein J2T09_003645 [Neorhizobium huautlense]|uniref:Uncharacterized protein n=1 Tax=Neorhizobium huautlense TaxID=67774 RepID=A0ABT9PWL8_9HYPH|nr:hypothetical protein [Neorhizobium huautlense]MDP9838873.1 hypothetical protein [Neorhizobium huautlense]